MKKDVAIIREAITKVVALLTKRSIKVTQRGAKAYVQYHAKTGAIQLVNLPYLPDDASEEFIAAVQGFLDHEVGHVLYTDPKIIPVIKKESGKVKNLANAIEDVYIERKMSEAFAGSAGNLNSVRKFYLDKIARPKIEEAIAAGDMNAAMGYAGLVQFRAWGGQELAIDFLRSNPTYAELVKPMAERLGEDVIAKIKAVRSSWDALDLAREMKKKLEEPSPPESDDGDDDEDGPKGAPSKEKSGGDDSDSKEDSKPSESEDPGTTRTETDDSDKEREKRSETEEDTKPEAGDKGGDDADERDSSDKPDDGKDDDDAKTESEPESDSGEPQEDASSTDDDSDTGGEDNDEEPQEGDESGEASTTDDDGDQDADSGSKDPLDDLEDDSSEPTGEGGDSDPDTDEDIDSPESPKDGTSRDDEPDLSEPFEEERDFDDELSKELSKAAVKEFSDSSYQVFSADWDQVEPAPMAKNDASIERMVSKTQHMVAGIQKSLERALAAKDRKTWNPGQRRGRISPGALFKTSVGDERIFRTRYETRAKSTAVSLLVDCSGSMSWSDKIETAALAAFALSSTLERLKITHEVIGFTTRQSRAMTSAMKAEGMGVRYAREEAIYMPVFKGFNERLTVEAKSRIAHLTEYSCHSWLRENIDGESLQIAARRLKTQRAERHLLIVLSDGSPACPGDYRALNSHLKDTASKLQEESSVEVVGIGILDESVRHFYKKAIVLNNLNDLPTTVVGELSKVLLAP